MLLLNFSHPLTEPQLAVVCDLVGDQIESVKTVACQFDHDRPFGEQARARVEGVGLSAEQWQTVPLLVNLPSLAVIAAVVLAEIHGRSGHFPPVLRLRPVAGSVPPRFEVAEVIDLQALQDEARKQALNQSTNEEDLNVSPNRLFVVVSTGQNVANLPPLLEHGEDGDQVVWVESAAARKAGWSAGTRAVLGRQRF